MAWTFALASILATAGPASAFLSNGLAVTPQMGWDNWNTFACDVSEDLLVSTAKHMVDVGLRDTGYNYVILDDCWSDGRDENGTLRADPKKFPNGMKHVADAIHALGMKFGMYSSAGTYTCAQYAGSLGYEKQDAAYWNETGVDYLKYDNCFNEGQTGSPIVTYNRYKTMANALNATGRPILYSMCNWGEDGPWNWAMTMANSWRATGDITDSFNRPDSRCPCTGDEGFTCLLPGFHCSVMNILNKIAPFVNKGQPGAWNDLDMLEVGNGGQTDSEYVLHATMWAAVKSAFILGTDVRKLDSNAYSIYTNPALIAINQDPLGSPAVRRWRQYITDDVDQYGQTGEISMWSGSLWPDNQIVILLNAGSRDMAMNASLADVFVDYGGANAKEVKMAYDLFDIWGNRMPNATAEQVLSTNSTQAAADLGNYWLNVTETSYADALAANSSVVLGKPVGQLQAGGTLQAMVPSHGVVAWRLRPVKAPAKDEL